MIKVQRNILHTQGFGCFMLLQIYSVAFLIGKTGTPPWIRLELFKPKTRHNKRFRFSLKYWGSKPPVCEGREYHSPDDLKEERGK